MKRNYFKLAMISFVASATFFFTSCKEDEKTTNNVSGDENASAIAAQFVDHTVAPTYTALAAATEDLADQLAALKANPSQSALQSACDKFLEARAWWEKLSSSVPLVISASTPISTAGPSTRVPLIP